MIKLPSLFSGDVMEVFTRHRALEVVRAMELTLVAQYRQPTVAGPHDMHMGGVARASKVTQGG